MQMNTKAKLNTYDHVHPSAFIRMSGFPSGTIKMC